MFICRCRYARCTRSLDSHEREQNSRTMLFVSGYNCTDKVSRFTTEDTVGTFCVTVCVTLRLTRVTKSAKCG